MIDEYDEVYDSTLIGRNDYIHILNSKYRSFERHIKNPEYANGLQLQDVDSTGKTKIFSSLSTKYSNKVIYIDFWAPWCSPCMAEMPASKKLQQTYKENDIVFVFLASRCTEKSWKATIAEQQLSGKHYLLSDEEYAVLSERFQFAGIPHYILVNKSGQVINADAPRPSEVNRLGEKIDKLL